jgi:F0F1-type ATP synthase delta subunit
MTTAEAYAKALFAKMSEDPGRSKEYLANLKKSVAARGYERLLPSILNEYQKLELREKRSSNRAKITPESERTRILLELYRKLVSTS